MTRDEYAELLVKIGGDPIGLTSRNERSDAEQAVLFRHTQEFWILVSLGDALHQFYRDSLDTIARSLVPGITDLQIAMANWHVVSFNRFAAGYHLAVHGYYFDAIALGRDLWEVSLSLAGLKKGIVTLQELIAANATNASEMESMSRKADRTIRDKLLKANTALSGAAKEAIDAFIYITNAAVHKSKLHTSLNLRNWASGNPIPIFPHFDLEQASAAYNVFFQASWGLFSTLPYLDFALPGSNRTWQERYERVQLAFVEGLGRGPKPYHQAWPTVIRAVF